MHQTVILSALLTAASLAQVQQSDRPPMKDHGPKDHGGPQRALFISPMGEPFRTERPDEAWFAGADVNKDGRLDRAEFRADAARFFSVLDQRGDGEIDPPDIDRYENELVPAIRVPDGGPGGVGSGERGGRGGRRGPPPGGGGPRGGGPGRGGPPGEDRDVGNAQREGGDTSHVVSRAGRQGAARFSYLDLPEPVTAADFSFNRGVDRAEFERAADQRFAQLDLNGDGVIEKSELPRIDTRVRGGGPRGRSPAPPPGPPPGEAPDNDTDDARS